MTMGMKDMPTLLAERSHRLGGDPGDSDFLERYATARRKDLERVIRFTDGLVRVFSNESTPLSLARNAALIVMDRIPAAKRLLCHHAMGYGTR